MSAGDWNVSRWVGIRNRWVGIGNRWEITLWSVIKKVLLDWLELSLQWELPSLGLKQMLSNVCQTLVLLIHFQHTLGVHVNIRSAEKCELKRSIPYIVIFGIRPKRFILLNVSQALKCSSVAQTLDFLPGAKSILMMKYQKVC